MTKAVNETEHHATLAIANAAELGAQVIKRIAGNDISTAVNGSVLTKEVIQSLVTRAVLKHLPC